MTRPFVFFIVLFWAALSLCDFNESLLGEGDDKDTLMLQDPNPSPDASKVLFSFQGDVWLMDVKTRVPRRLTVHEAEDSRPMWSPDGKLIAFMSNRGGNSDLFVMDAEGRNIRQITWSASNEVLFNWSPDGKYLLFTSTLPAPRAPRDRWLYRVSIEGGLWEPVLKTSVSWACQSPDASQILFTDGSGFNYSRKGYKGAATADLWLYDLKTEKFQSLIRGDYHVFWSMWGPDSKTAYIVCEKDGTSNLWKLNTENGKMEQLTTHKDDGVRHPAISKDGSIILYECLYEIWALHVKSGKAEKWPLRLPEDGRDTDLQRKIFTGNATEMAVSADGKQIAFVIRGEVFIMPDKGGRAFRVTDNPGWDRHISWSPDGKTLALASARNANSDIHFAVSADKDEPLPAKAKKLEIKSFIATEAQETNPQWSPDGKRLAFKRGKGELVVVEVESKKESSLVKGWNLGKFEWSPDGKWLAYNKEDDNFNSDIYIQPADGGQALNLSRHPDSDWGASWSADGRQLVFLSSRALDNNAEVYAVYLRKSDHEKQDEEWENEEAAPKGGGKKKGGKEDEPKPDDPKQPGENPDPENPDEKPDEKPEKKLPEVKIDLDEIWKRLRRVTHTDANESWASALPEGKGYVFVSDVLGQDDLWAVNRKGQELKSWTSGGFGPSELQWSGDKKLYCLGRGGLPFSMSAGAADRKAISFRAQMVWSAAQERAESFADAWNILNENFYDKDFHGVDWKAVREKYAPLASSVTTDHDFYGVLDDMFGELKASHTGASYFGGDFKAPNGGFLGLEFDPGDDGEGLKILDVLKDGPADQERCSLKPGDRVFSIDGNLLSRKEDPAKYLIGMVGEKILLEIQRAGKEEKESAFCYPTSYAGIRALSYEAWIRENRNAIKELSGGKLAYVHVKSMDTSSLAEFETDLFAEADGKDALIIDVRDNGGGWTTDYLLAMLNAKRHATTVPRDGGPGYPQDRLPLASWQKPVGLLCNENSFSNAEIISHAFKTLKLGPVVGRRTHGSVISTGSRALIDGGAVRLPFRGWWAEGSGQNLEGNGAVPDVEILESPADAISGHDRQLEKLVEIMMKKESK